MPTNPTLGGTLEDIEMNKIISVLFLIAFTLGAITLNEIVQRQTQLEQTVATYMTPKIDLDGDEVMALLNLRRQEMDKKWYEKSRYLCGWADERLVEIQVSFTHEGFNKEYPNVYDRTDFKELGENLVKDVTSERDAIRAWENSKEHKEMLDKDYK